MPRPWVRFDVGLLDDERFEDLNAEQLEAWVKSYLIIAREGDAIRDLARLARLLTKEGVAHSAQRLDELSRLDWFVPSSRVDGALTLRGYEKRQPVYRGPSDLPDAKHRRNAGRSSTRSGRGASVERGGATRDSTGRDGTLRSQKEGASVERGGASPKPLKDIIGAFEDIIPPKV